MPKHRADPPSRGLMHGPQRHLEGDLTGADREMFDDDLSQALDLLARPRTWIATAALILIAILSLAATAVALLT